MDPMAVVVDEAETSQAEGLPAMTKEEAQALQNVLEQLNEAADGMIRSLDRMHLVMEEIKSELRAAHGRHTREERTLAA